MQRTALRGVLAVLLASVPAVAQVDFRATLCFGDSLTNNDLWGSVKHPLYGNDPMEAAFAKGAGASDRLALYAVPGAQSRGVRDQMILYAFQFLLGQQPLGTTISFEIGGNDVLANVNLLTTFGPGPFTDPTTNRVIETMLNDLVLFAFYHPGARIVVWTIPDVPSAPLHWSLNDAQKANLRANVARINDVLRSLEFFANVAVVDVAELWRTTALVPPVLKGRRLLPPPAFGQRDALFADPIHPNAVFNALHANAILERLNLRFGTRFLRYSEDELAALAGIP